MKKLKHKETEAERKLRYSRSSAEIKRRQRKEWNRSKREGKTHMRRLAFLREALRRLGISQKEFAHSLGWTPQNVSYHFIMADDMRYRALQKALKAFGIRFYARLIPNRQPTLVLDREKYRMQITSTLLAKPIPDYLEDCIRRRSPVAFVAQAIKESGKTVGAISRQAGFEASSFRRFIMDDDMRISFLYKIADVIGAKIEWVITPIDSEQEW